MKSALKMAAAFALADLSAATMNAKYRHMYESKGMDMDAIYARQEAWMSKSARSIQKAENRSSMLQSAYHLKQKKLSSEFDEQWSAEEEKILDAVCDGDVENCDEQKIDMVEFTFTTGKGLFVGVSAVYNDECRAGLTGVMDSALAIYENSAFYYPDKFNKFGIAITDLTQATNQIFTTCDFTHFWNELTKLVEWQNWEQYVEIVVRAGGVCIQDLWDAIDIIKVAAKAGDGYATGL